MKNPNDKEIKDPYDKVPLQQPVIFYKMDPSGFLVNESELKYVKKPMTDVIDDLRSILGTYLGNSLHSVYVNGDFAKGKPFKMPTEFLLLIVLKERTETNWVDEYKQYILGKYPFIKRILIEIRLIDDVLGWESYRFSLKNEFLCIYGDNIALKLEKTKPDSRLSFRSKRFEESIDPWCQFLYDNRNNDETIKHAGASFCSLMIRTGFELCIEREKKYTNDLYTCYRVFAKYYPDKEELMRKAYNLTKEPTANAQRIINLLLGLGKWLVAIIQLNNVEKELKKSK